MITKEMVKHWLEDNYHKWIATVIVDICNDPSDIEHLKKQIKYDWDNKGYNMKELKHTNLKEKYASLEPSKDK